MNHHHTQHLLARTVRVVAALADKGCEVTKITVEGSMPLIVIDQPPIDGPAMVIAIRSNGYVPRTVWVADWKGCRLECPARHPVTTRSAVPLYPREVA